MKRFSTFAISRTGIVTLLSLGLIVFSISFVSIQDKGKRFESINSSFSLLSPAFTSAESVTSNAVNANAEFTFDDGELSDISDFQFSVPLGMFKSSDVEAEQAVQKIFKTIDKEDLTFVQQRVMILPTMKMIHLVGEISIANIQKPISFQLAYLHENQVLKIKGKQTIRLNELGINIPSELRSIIKNEFDLQFDLRMVESGPKISTSNLLF
ncbi:MAG: hypothetical protein EOO90_12880 [Pedobacter sp.]|nr:MAG: hypothetical protein EOO90_12880 [Pedobacter sp.]